MWPAARESARIQTVQIATFGMDPPWPIGARAGDVPYSCGVSQSALNSPAICSLVRAAPISPSLVMVSGSVMPAPRQGTRTGTLTGSGGENCGT